MDGSPFNRTVGIFHINAGHGGVSVNGDVGRDNFVEQLWALFHPNGKLVRAGNAAHFLGEEFGSGLADQPPGDLSNGEGADFPVRFGGGDDAGREVGAEDLCWDVSSGGFPNACTEVSIASCHPFPMFVPATPRSGGSALGGNFDGEQEWQRKICLSSSVKGECLRVDGLRFGLRVKFGPVSLDVGGGGTPH